MAGKAVPMTDETDDAAEHDLTCFVGGQAGENISSLRSGRNDSYVAAWSQPSSTRVSLTTATIKS
jgi:hypothetical protein